MIFVTVGNDFRGFDRLLKKMDEIAPLIPAEVLMQRGYSPYRPIHAKHFDFVTLHQATEYIRQSELVVSHAGIGTIILCREYGVPILILPRRKALGEHMNDHQGEIARALEKREHENIHVVYEEDQLKGKVLEILREGRRDAPKREKTGAGLIKAIRGFIQEV